MGRFIFHEGNSFFYLHEFKCETVFRHGPIYRDPLGRPSSFDFLNYYIFSFADSEQSLRSATVNGAPDFMAFKTILVGITPCITQGTISPKWLAKGFQKPLSTG